MFLHNILEENVLKSLVKVLMTKGLQLLIGLLSKYHLLNEQIYLEIFPPMKSSPLTSHDYRENEITHMKRFCNYKEFYKQEYSYHLRC